MNNDIVITAEFLEIFTVVTLSVLIGLVIGFGVSLRAK